LGGSPGLRVGLAATFRPCGGFTTEELWPEFPVASLGEVELRGFTMPVLPLEFGSFDTGASEVGTVAKSLSSFDIGAQKLFQANGFELRSVGLVYRKRAYVRQA